MSFQAESIARWARCLRAGAAACAATAAVWAQDVTVTKPAWTAPNGAPEELPALKSRPVIAVPDELKAATDIGYVVYNLVLSAKGQTLMLAPHATLAAYERAAFGWSGSFAWTPGKRAGKGVNTDTTFAVIFNPASAAEKGPDATPRLLEVTATQVRAPKAKEAVPDRVEFAEVTVDATGKVTEVKGAPADLERACAIAASAWRFAPARKGGAAVAATVRMPFVVVTAGGSEKGGPRTTGRVLHQERPIYPFEMRASLMKGEVVVDFVVDIEGRVRNPFVVRSLNPSFDDPAIEAVRRWTFEPGRLGERPVPTHMQVPIIFHLDDTYEGGQGPISAARKPDMSKMPEQFRYDSPPKPRGTVRPVYPYELLKKKVTGKASVVYIVNTAGKVAQADVRSATAPEFGRALQAAIECFVFEPALKGGRPNAALEGFAQEFDRDQRWALVATEDLDLLRREEKRPESFLSLADLDAPPVPRSRRPPQFPQSAPEGMTKGEATVEFIIDEEGRARLPRIVAATDEAFGYAAVQSVASWRFEPPTRGGKAVAVRAQIPIVFGGGEEKPKPAR